MIVWQIILLIFLLILSGLFSGAEVALVSLGQIRLRSLLKKKRKGALAVKKLKNNPQRMIITILIGNNVANIGASVLATLITTDLFGSNGAGIAVGVMTFLVLVFGEITPKSYAAAHAENVSFMVAKPIWILGKILLPVIVVFEWITNTSLKMFGQPKKRKLLTEDDIKIAIDIGVEEKSIEKDEREMMNNVLDFNDISAHEVMTKKKDMFCLDANMKVKDSFSAIAKSPYSRIPLFKGSLDKIVGVIHLKDLIEAVNEKEGELPLMDIAVRPLFVDENILLDDLFKLFQERHTHIAIVRDDNKKIVGLVTIENLLEELVGEIIDESDVNPHRIMRINKNTILVDGETSPKYVNSFFQTNIDENYKTMHDFLVDQFKGMPKRRQEIKVRNHSYLIEEVGEDHIERILIRKMKK
ncbi:MAG: hemolysin family protein [archaeon]